MKLKYIILFFIQSLSILNVQAISDNIQNLPTPYNSLEKILPFDDHGWYFNGQWIQLLFKNNNIKTAIEVGSWLGKSTRHIASLLPAHGRLYAVDTWKGSLCQQIDNDPFHCAHKVPTLYEQFLSNVIHANLTNKIIPIQMPSLKASKELSSLIQQIDFIYIDAEHDTESVFKDMEAWYPYISGKRGILCGDDWSWESVRIAVRNFAQIYNVTIYTGENFWFIVENGQYNELSFLQAPESVWQIIKNDILKKDNNSPLIEHVTNSIKNAELGISQLNSEILNLEGMSSDKVRHFLNNICSLENGKYLEIGVWKGSTFISALYKNTLQDAIAVDNWALFSGPKDTFQKNISHFLENTIYTFYESDCFKFDLKKIKNKINIYFYDGGHTFEDQKLAFTYYNEIFADTFIAIVDDYNWIEVQNGTQKAFKELGYNILFEQFLPSSHNGDTTSWWNGIYVAVISKI